MTPSDDDLDSLLQAWTAPACPGSLDKRLRRTYLERSASQHAPRAWTRWFSPAMGMFAGMAAAVAVCLLVVAQAFPQSMTGSSGTRAPLVVDSVELEYKADGSSAVIEHKKEIDGLAVSTEYPGDAIRTAEQRILDPLNLIRFRIMRLYWERREAELEARFPMRAKMIAEQQRDCSVPGTPWTVVGHSTVLHYTTTGIQKVWMEEGKPVRLTEWSAPALRCFVLKSTTEKTIDGQYRLAFERRALKVAFAR